MAVSANRLELLQIADAVAREKTIDRRIVIGAMEDAIQKAAKSRYGMETDVRAEIDQKTGEIRLQRLLEVVENVEIDAAQISRRGRARAQPRRAGRRLHFRAAAAARLRPHRRQSAKQVIMQKVREAERDRQYEDYKDRIGEIVNGTVKRVEYGNVVVDLGRGEAIIRRDEMIPRETFRYGDRVRAYVYDVRREQRGPQIFLSRTHPQFMAKLFTMEVPEIYDGIIEIKSVARDPGSPRQDRGRLARHARSTRSAPASACAAAACRRWSASLPASASTSFRGTPTPPPSSSTRCSRPRSPRWCSTRTPSASRSSSPDDQLSLAIGRRGQNVRLASQLTGWDIDILTEDEESERRQKEFQERQPALHGGARRRRDGGAAARLGRLRQRRGGRLRRAVSEVASIEGFDEETAEELQARAREYLEKIEAEQDEERKKLGVADEMKEVPGVTTAMMVALGKDDIKTLEDLAYCAADDLVGWTERKDGETTRFEGALSGFEHRARRGRGDRHGGAAQGRHRHRGRSRRRRPKTLAERRRPRFDGSARR